MENAMETRFIMLNQDVVSDEHRIKLLQKIRSDFYEGFKQLKKKNNYDSEQVAFNKTTLSEITLSRRIIFIHNTQYSFKQALNEINSWHETFKKTSCLVFYSGGGLDPEPAIAAIKEFEAKGMKDQIQILYDRFDDLSSFRVGLIKQLCDSFEKDCRRGDGKWTEFEKVNINQQEEKQSLDQLFALDILLQGYLAINNPEKFFAEELQKTGKDAARFLKDNNILQGEQQQKEARARIASDRLFRNKADNGVYGKEKSGNQPQVDGYFWFDECLPDIAKSWNETGFGNGLGNVENIWTLIYNAKTGKPDTLPDNITEIIADAHKECAELFIENDKKKRLTALNSLRITLNHNRVKNNFVNKLANADQSLPLNRRTENIISAWEIIRNPEVAKKSDTMRARRITVDDGLKDWPVIEQEIRVFFNNAVAGAGLIYTDKGTALKNKITGAKGCLEHISSFVQDFAAIAAEDETVRNDRLKQFLQSVDLLHDGLSSMRYTEGDSALFGGHLTESEK
jgi:hypothetical protein